MNLAQIASQLRCNQEVPSIPITGFSIDTRNMSPGCLFVAIKGARFDGHDFVAMAVESGAAAILCQRLNPSIERRLQLVVPDTLKALACLATWHRKNMPSPVIAVTGSNGKTSVKEMIYNILPKPSLATQGNLNNHIGAPLSVLQLNRTHRYAVFELGANHAGEIALTSAIVQPQVALITNIAPAHIEGFGSIEGVAMAKGEIYANLDQRGTAIVNDDDYFAHFWDKINAGKEVLRFSLNKPADVTAKDVHYNPIGCASFTLVLPNAEADIALQVPGEHAISNALAAAASAWALGIAIPDIVRGLNAFQGVPGRMIYLEGKNSSIIIDDTYNANLRSVLIAITVLAKRPGHRILVLGDMGELGSFTQEHHAEIGRAAQLQGIDLLFSCGSHSVFSSEAFGTLGKHYTSQDELSHDLLAYLDKETTVLVKGSRSARMEKIVQQLLSTSVNAPSAIETTESTCEQDLKLPST